MNNQQQFCIVFKFHKNQRSLELARKGITPVYQANQAQMATIASALKQIVKLEEQLAKLKLSLSNAAAKESKESKELKVVKPRVRKDKPDTIDSCKSEKDLDKFTKKEILEWIKQKDIVLKKASAALKKDLVKAVWEHMNCDAESDSSDSESETEDNSV